MTNNGLTDRFFGIHTETVRGRDMKKIYAAFAICLFVCTVTVFAQAVDKTQYKAIDPFDFKLEDEHATWGAVRKFKSVVKFVSQSGTDFLFSSLDQGTSLQLASASAKAPSAGQTVTIYYTATKGVRTPLALDEIDTDNTTEAGIKLAKSAIPKSSGIKKTDYKEMDPIDFTIDMARADFGEVHKFKSTVLFSSQDGINYHFTSMEGSDYAELHMKVGRRFPPLKENQRVTIYYTGKKEGTDVVTLDDIDL